MFLHVPLTLFFKNPQHSLLRVRVGKGNKTRSVPLNASAREAIAICVAPRLGIEISSLKAVAGGLVPKETSSHALCHTFARSYLAQYQGDVVGMAILLGHNSLDTTRLYSQPEVSQLAVRIERLEINAYSR